MVVDLKKVLTSVKTMGTWGLKNEFGRFGDMLDKTYK